MFYTTISGGGDETQTKFTQQVAGCDQIVTPRRATFRRQCGEEEMRTQSSTLKTQVNGMGLMTLAWGPFLGVIFSRSNFCSMISTRGERNRMLAPGEENRIRGEDCFLSVDMSVCSSNLFMPGIWKASLASTVSGRPEKPNGFCICLWAHALNWAGKCPWAGNKVPRERH